MSFTQVEPTPNADWINQSENSWTSLIPIADRKQRVTGSPKAVFQLSSLGVATNRDDWVYDDNPEAVEAKIGFFADKFHSERQRWLADSRPELSSWVDRSIKWTSELEAHLKKGSTIPNTKAHYRTALYRPFTARHTFYAPVMTHRTYRQTAIFPFSSSAANRYIAFTDPTGQKPFMAMASDILPDLHLVGSGAGAMCLPLHRYAANGEALENVTTWALSKFVAHYGKAAKITKDDIFHYVYGVLHDPVYRTSYAQNLKRELPRIPLYPDFRQWAGWGKRLMDLHIGYESVDPWPVTRTDTPDTKARTAGVPPKVILKSDPDNGTITLDSETVISGIPKEAWDYRLGNRSGLDWILDQHKEKTPKDPTIREKFNTYRFADHKEKVADLIARVTRVSVETVEIVEAMKGAKREAVAAG